jgi:GntR family transcriptional repressor for pyruvate dehydrogenase complex
MQGSTEGCQVVDGLKELRGSSAAIGPSDVAKRLLAFFLSGAVQVGERIPPERVLAETLGVGRSVVREAVKSLALLGLVEIRQGDGTYLRRPDSPVISQAMAWGLLLGVKRTHDLVETRRVLEMDLAGLAAERRDDQDCADLRHLLDQMRKAGNHRDKLARVDIAFHLRLAAASHNEVLTDLLSGITSLMSVWIARVLRQVDDFAQDYAEHEQVLAAVERGDVAGARAVMDAKLRRGSQLLLKSIEQESQSPRRSTTRTAGPSRRPAAAAWAPSASALGSSRVDRCG